VADGFRDFAAMEEENSRHALDIARGETHEVAIEHSDKHVGKAFAIEIRLETGTSETKRFLEKAGWNREATKVIDKPESFQCEISSARLVWVTNCG
jgi:hypothetical protein